jgi:hypothetical protein
MTGADAKHGGASTVLPPEELNGNNRAQLA